MSGNGVSPIPDDKILAYIYDDVDDSDIFALESLDTKSTNADTKNEDNKESADIETNEVLKENENLKAIVKQLQLEKDMLELRISEVYKTAKAEIERKDRRVQELNEEKNNILFRRNKNFINRQPQHTATDTTKPRPEKELTNEEFQKFNVTYKIPKRRHFDDKDTGQEKKKPDNLPRPVLEDEEELKIVSRNDRQHDPRKTGYNKDNYSPVGESSIASKERGCHDMPSRKSSLHDTRSRPRNRSEDRPTRPLQTLSGSASVKSEYKNNCNILDEDQKAARAIVEESLDTKERTETKNGFKYQQRRKSISEPQVPDLNKDYPKVENMRDSISPSGSPPRQNSHYRRSRSLCRGRIDEQNKYRCKSEHRGPVTPPGSPPRDLQDTRKNTSNETNYRSRKKHGTHSKSPHDKDYDNRQKAHFRLDQQNEVQRREDSNKLSEETQIVDMIKTEDIHHVQVVSKEKESNQELDKIRTLDVKKGEERQCRSKSKEKQTNLREEVKVRSRDTGKDGERRCRSKSKERDGRDRGSDKILVDSKTHKKLTDRRPINSRRHSRRSRSRSREKDNRRQNFRNRSRSKGYSRRSPERDRYRKNFREGITRLGNPSNRNKISNFDRNPVRRDRYLGYRDWKNRNRDCPQNMDSRRHYRENHMLPNFNRLRERVLRYSLERAPEALNDVTKTKDKKDLLKGNDTDHSDLEDLRLHLSGASDEISSNEDAKEGKYDQMNDDDHFELLKHLGANIQQMDDDELERLLQGRKKELEAVYDDLEEKMSVEHETVFSDYEENHLTEGEDTEAIDKVYISVEKQECDRNSGVEFKEFPVKDKKESVHKNQIEDRIICSENENKTCQQTFKTVFEERQCIRQKVKQNQNVNDKLDRSGNSTEMNTGPKKLESEDKIIGDAQQKFTNTFEAMQHPKITEKQNGNENIRNRHNKQPQMLEKYVEKHKGSKLSSDLNTHTLCEETSKKSYNSIMETIEEAKTKHIDFLLTKREDKAIKKQYTFVNHQDSPSHSASGSTLETKDSPIEETSQYRDPRQNSNSKDLREKCAEEKDACDAHSRQKKIKIGLDAYMKRKKADCADAVKVPHSEAPTEPVPVNDKHIISKSEKGNEVSADMLLTVPNESDKDVDIILQEEINNDKSGHPDIQKVANEDSDPNKKVSNREPETVNEVKSIPENPITNNKDNIILEYSRVVTDEDDENVIPVQENSRESSGDIKDTNSFLHDFSLSEDEDDIQTQQDLLKNDTNSHQGKEKIKILDITIVRPSLISAPGGNPKMKLTQPESKFDVVDSSALDGKNSCFGSPESIEQIQEAVHESSVNMKQSDHIINHQHDSAEKLDTEELKKCLEDDESQTKDELRMQDKSLARKHSDQKIAKGKVNLSDKNGAPQDFKTEKQKQEERMLLLFGESPSPRPPSSTASEKPNANAEQLKRVKRNLMVESTKNTKSQKKLNVHKKKTARSISLDERLFRKPVVEEDEFEEKRTEDESKSFNNGRVTTPVQYPLFCNNPTYIPNLQNSVAFDSPNRYIRKKIDQYKEITGTEIKSEMKHKRNIIPDLCSEENRGEKKCTEKTRKVNAQEADEGSKSLVEKPNEIGEPEKKPRSKNTWFKIEMHRNQSVKRRGTGNSDECRQTKRKKFHHSLLDSSNEDQSSSSDSEIISANKNSDGGIGRKNKRITKDKSTKIPNRKSKKNLKRKKGVDAENASGKMNTITESAPISSSQSELNISNEKKCEREESKTKLQKEGRKKTISKELAEDQQETGGVEQHCKESLTETEVVLRRGGRIRKQPGRYQSSIKRITPVKIGESSNKISTTRNATAQNINTSGGSDEISAAVNSQNTKLIGTNKRKLHLNDEKAKPEKCPRLGDKVSPEKSDSVPLPNIQETLKQCEMKICETSDPRVEDVPAISTDVAAIDCEKQNRSFNESSLPEINLDTKDADLLGSFERGLFENMNDYLCDKSLLSLGSEGKPKSDKDSNSGTNELTKIENTKEGVNQVTFSNFLKDNTNTSTPIKISNETKQNKTANAISTVQTVSSQSATSNNNSCDKTSQGMCSTSSNTVILTKSYLATPLKRDRRRRIGVVMVDVT